MCDVISITMIDGLETQVTMLERHLQVLNTVLDREPIGIVNLAEATGYPKHKVRYSLRILEEASVIEPSPQGAITTEHVDEFVTDVNERITTDNGRLDTLTFPSAAMIDS